MSKPHAKLIHIIEFEHPYCFRFKFDDDLHDEKLQKVEDEICAFARREVKNTEKIDYKADDQVAVYQVVWGKWVRARVLANFPKLNQCYVYAYDHGQKFFSSHFNTVLLPEDFIEEKVEGVHFGSLCDVAPGRREYDYELFKPVVRQHDIWSENAIEQCKKIIDYSQVVNICFDVKSSKNNYYFGNLYATTLITNGDGSTTQHTVDFKKVLLEIKQGIEVNIDADMWSISMRFSDAIDGPELPKKLKDLSQSNGNGVRPDAIATGSSTESSMDGSSTIGAPSTVINESEINDGITQMNLSHAAPSVVSTIAPSEIDGGVTLGQNKILNPNTRERPYTSDGSERDGNSKQMNLSHATPSVVSTIAPSEIDGGVTLCQNNILNPNTRERPYTPAGSERDGNSKRKKKNYKYSKGISEDI